MLVSYWELEKMTDLFALGGYFIFMVFGSYLSFKQSRHQVHRVTAWVLVWWSVLVFDGYIGYLFDITTPEGKLASEQYDRFANVLDMTASVCCVMIGYALTYARKVSVGLMALHSIPYVVFLCAVLFTQSDLWMMIALVWTIVYSLAFLAYFALQVRAYIARLHAVYSDDSARNLNWLKTLMWVFLAMLVVWAIPSYMHTVGSYVIFYVSSIALWWVAINKILKQQPVNIRYFAGRQEDDTIENQVADDPLLSPVEKDVELPDTFVESEGDEMDDVEVTDRRYSFAPRLKVMFEKEQVYLQPDLNINELARILGTNRAYLSAYLNTVKNVTFFDFVNSWRLKKAEHLLTTTNDTVDLIADNCGFNNTYSFRRVFVKSFGVTPTEWRHLSAEERKEIMPKFD